MADTSKRVDFQAGGNLLQYMQQVRNEAKAASSEALVNAQKQTNATKEQISLIRQQLELEQKKRNEARESLLKGDKAEIDRIRRTLESPSNFGAKQRQIHEQRLMEREAAYSQLKSEMEGEDKEYIRILREIANSLETGKDDTIRSNNEIFNAIIEEQQRQRLQEQQSSHAGGGSGDDDSGTAIGRKSGKSGKGGGFFGSLMGVEQIKQVMSDFRQMGRTEDGFDAIVATNTATARIIGGIIGGIIGSIIEPGGGTVVGAAGGATIAGEFVGGFTEQMKRAYDTGMLFSQGLARYQALTGGDADFVRGGNRGLGESMGLSLIDIVNMNKEIATRSGVSNNILDAEQITALEKAIGIQTQTTLELVDVQRLGVNGSKDVTKTITGLLKAGEIGGLFKNGDRTFLGEFVEQFGTLTKQLASVQTERNDALVTQLLLGFNSIGGQWSLRDPRAMGNISNVNQALARPGDDFAQALNYRIIRDAMPNASLDQILEEETKGAFSKILLPGILSQYGAAPTGTQLTAIRNRLGGNLSYDAIRELFANKDAIFNGSFDPSMLLKGMSEEELYGQAAKYTTDAEKKRAEITNAYIDGAKEGIEAAIAKITEAIAAVFDRSAIKVTIDKNGDGWYNIGDGVNQVPIKNKTFTPYSQYGYYPGMTIPNR